MGSVLPEGPSPSKGLPLFSTSRTGNAQCVIIGWDRDTMGVPSVGLFSTGPRELVLTLQMVDLHLAFITRPW